MSTIAYGLGQGFASGADSVANAVATAERIKNNREQLRIQNQYAQLAQDKWGVQKQQEELAIRETNMKLDAIENEMVANKASNFLIDGYEYGNYKQFQNFVLTNQKMKGILNTLGIVNIEGLNDYTDKSIDAIAGNPELAQQIRQNKNGYLVVTDSKGNKSLVDTMLLAGQMGVQKYVNMNRIERMNALQNRLLEQAQTSAVKAQTTEAMKDPLNYSSSKAIEQWLVANPDAGKGVATAQAKAQKRKVDYESFNQNANATMADFLNVLSSPERPTEQQASSTFSKGIRLSKSELGLNSIEDAIAIIDDPNATQESKNLANSVISGLEAVKPKTAKDVDTFLVNSEIYKTLDNFDRLVSDLSTYDPSTLAPTDKIVQDIAKYLNVSGEDALNIIKEREIFSNFQTITNTIRHALYGAQLTPTEATSFDNAVGNIAQSKANMLIGIKNLLTQSDSTFKEARRKNVEWFDWKYKGSMDKLTKALQKTDTMISEIKGKQLQSKQPKSSAVVNSLQSQQPQPQQGSNADLFRQNILKAKGGQ